MNLNKTIRWFINLLYAAQPAEFKSSFDLAISIEQLKAATAGRFCGALFHQSAVGCVKENHVSLQRVIPLIRNPFKPYFIGRFETINNHVVLTGHFTMHWFTKLWFSSWFAGIIAILAVGGAALLTKPYPNAWMMFPFCLAMAGFGIALIWLSKSFAGNDAAWLSDVIRSALAGEHNNRHASSRRKKVGAASRARQHRSLQTMKELK